MTKSNWRDATEGPTPESIQSAKDAQQCERIAAGFGEFWFAFSGGLDVQPPHDPILCALTIRADSLTEAKKEFEHLYSVTYGCGYTEQAAIEQLIRAIGGANQ